MSFSDIVNEALDRVRGAQAAGVVGADGLGVELVTHDGALDPQALELELGEVASTISGAAQRLSGGSVRDFLIEMDRSTVLAAQVLPGYYAVLAIEPQAHLGRARFAVKQMAQRLQAEL